jgi:hypothetical protein
VRGRGSVNNAWAEGEAEETDVFMQAGALVRDSRGRRRHCWWGEDGGDVDERVVEGLRGGSSWEEWSRKRGEKAHLVLLENSFVRKSAIGENEIIERAADLFADLGLYELEGGVLLETKRNVSTEGKKGRGRSGLCKRWEVEAEGWRWKCGRGHGS